MLIPQGGIFSVALSLGSPPVAVSDHPALRSSDFPPAARFARRAIPRPPSATFNTGEKGEEAKGRKRILFAFPLRFFPFSPLSFYFLIYGFIGQLVGPAVFFPRYTQDTILGEPIQGFPGFVVEGFEARLPNPVLAPELANDQF